MRDRQQLRRLRHLGEHLPALGPDPVDVIELQGDPRGLEPTVTLGLTRFWGKVFEPVTLSVYSIPKVTLFPVFLTVFGSVYYYSLSMTLMEKAGVLAASGVVLLGARAVITRGTPRVGASAVRGEG